MLVQRQPCRPDGPAARRRKVSDFDTANIFMSNFHPSPDCSRKLAAVHISHLTAEFRPFMIVPREVGLKRILRAGLRECQQRGSGARPGGDAKEQNRLLENNCSLMASGTAKSVPH
jgi:hypothetical protein